MRNSSQRCAVAGGDLAETNIGTARLSYAYGVDGPADPRPICCQIFFPIRDPFEVRPDFQNVSTFRKADVIKLAIASLRPALVSLAPARLSSPSDLAPTLVRKPANCLFPSWEINCVPVAGVMFQIVRMGRLSNAFACGQQSLVLNAAYCSSWSPFFEDAIKSKSDASFWRDGSAYFSAKPCKIARFSGSKIQ